MHSTWNFSVSEIFPDGRVLVATYVRIEDHVSLVMDVYDDMTLQDGKRYLNYQQGDTPTLRKANTLEAD